MNTIKEVYMYDIEELQKQNAHLKDIILKIAEMVCDDELSYGDLENWMTEMGILKQQVKDCI